MRNKIIKKKNIFYNYNKRWVTRKIEPEAKSAESQCPEGRSLDKLLVHWVDAVINCDFWEIVNKMNKTLSMAWKWIFLTELLAVVDRRMSGQHLRTYL